MGKKMISCRIGLMLLFFIASSILLIAPNGSEAADKPMILKASIQSPVGIPYTKSFYWWLDEIEKRTGGRIKFQRYPGQSLAKTAEQIDAAKSGMADIACISPLYTPGKTPLHIAPTLPGIHETAWVNIKALWDLYEQVPAIKEELAGLNTIPIATWGTGPYYIFTVKKPLTSLEDLKGMKIGATGGPAALLNHLGAAPIGIPVTEYYESMQRGVIDGVVAGPSSGGGYHVHEVAKYLNLLPIGGLAGPYVINMNTWKKFPADIKKIILGLQNDFAEAMQKIYVVEGDMKYMKIFEQAKVQFIKPSPDFRKKVFDIAKEKIWSKWAKEKDSQGLQGTKTLEVYLALTEKYSKLNPFK